MFQPNVRKNAENTHADLHVAPDFCTLGLEGVEKLSGVFATQIYEPDLGMIPVVATAEDDPVYRVSGE